MIEYLSSYNISGINDGVHYLVDGNIGNVHTGEVTRLPAKVVGVADGAWHTLALTSDQQVYVDGVGYTGQLGLGEVTGVDEFTHLPITKVVGMAVGPLHTLLLTSSGQVFGFGSNRHGQLRLSAPCYETPTLITNHARWIETTDTSSRITTCSGRVIVYG